MFYELSTRRASLFHEINFYLRSTTHPYEEATKFGDSIIIFNDKFNCLCTEFHLMGGEWQWIK